MKLTVILIFLIILVFNCKLNAETTIPAGEVSGTWTKSESPYHVTGNIIIPDSLTLAIEPGGVLQFNDSCKLTVKGRLLAEGTENDSITFTARNQDSGWYGIYFDNINDNNDSSMINYSIYELCKNQYAMMIDSSSKIVIRHTRFSKHEDENNKNDMISVLYCFYSNPKISFCNFLNNGIETVLKNGVIICEHSSPEIINSSFYNNYSESTGGILCKESSNPTISNCNISNNSAKGSGGGIAILEKCSPNINNCTITKNKSGNYGGAIYSTSNELLIENCIISGNVAVHGGGIGLFNNYHYGNLLVTIKNCQINNNKAPEGGGIHKYFCNLVIENCVITNNESENGGGISAYGNPTIIKNCLISKNIATLGGGILLESTQSSVINSTIVDNFGTGIFCINSSFNIITNTIIFKNHDSQIIISKGKHPDLFYCNIQGGIENIECPSSINFTGIFYNCINSDPMFDNGGSRSYTLKNNSPCINNGTPDTKGLNLSQDDLAGFKRIARERIDIGAFEYQGELPGEQEIEVNSLHFQFEQQSICTQSTEESLIIRNKGKTDMKVDVFMPLKIFLIKESNDSNYRTLFNELIIKAESEDTIFISFKPDKPSIFKDSIRIYSNDNDEPLVIVSLSGEGTGSPVFAGTIEKDTCWSDSIYIIGDIFIPDSITLCINPGTKVIFTGNYRIDVQGRLLAVGDDDHLIRFTISDTTLFNDTSKTDGGWNGIRFNNTPVTNDSSKIINCQLEYCKKINKIQNDIDGGAIYVKNFSKLIFENNIVSHNLALGHGGGIYCESSSITIDNSNIYENKAFSSGGCIFCSGGIPIISNNVIKNNKSTNSGGGICSIYGPIIIMKNEFNNNSSAEGSAIYCEQSISINNVIIIGNKISNNIGGDAINCENCSIINNQIVSNQLNGISISESCSIINNTICNNRRGISAFNCHSLMFINNTICFNNDIGLLLCYASPEIWNSIIFGNKSGDNPLQIELWDDTGDPDSQNQTRPHIFYSDIEGGLKAIKVTEQWGFTGKYQNNINKDPMFTYDPDNPYALSENSPCINAGAPDTTGLNIPLLDIIGMPRFHAGRIDMGAYEFQGEVSVEEFTKNKYIMVYPNPTDGLLILDIISHDLLPVTVQIVDLTGNILLTDNINNIHNRVDISVFPNGQYYLILFNKRETFSKILTIIK